MPRQSTSDLLTAIGAIDDLETRGRVAHAVAGVLADVLILPSVERAECGVKLLRSLREIVRSADEALIERVRVRLAQAVTRARGAS